MILLNPGPVNLSPRVRSALLEPDLCHREPEYLDMQARIRRRLLEVYGLDPDDWSAVLLSGSGTAAVEAMLASLVPEGEGVIVVENGVYGERMTRMAQVHGMPVQVIRRNWGATIDSTDVARALDEETSIRFVAVVHHETTTGRLNDLDGLGSVCRARGVHLLVDAVSSFGAERIDPEAGALGACAASANKCLHGVPGVSFVVARRTLLDAAPNPPRSISLDLAAAHGAQDRGGTAFTPAVHACYALDAALTELEEAGGWSARHRRYTALGDRVRIRLQRLGFAPLLADGPTSCVLTAFRLTSSHEYDALHDALKQRGFVIYAGQGPLDRRIFRVATMGAISEADIERLLASVEAWCGDRAHRARSAEDPAAA